MDYKEFTNKYSNYLNSINDVVEYIDWIDDADSAYLNSVTITYPDNTKITLNPYTRGGVGECWDVEVNVCDSIESDEITLTDRQQKRLFGY